MPDIFLSYAKQNHATVSAIYELLSDSGFNVWYDKFLLKGKDYDDELTQRLDQSTVVIVLWCKHSTKSGMVGAEAASAAMQDKYIGLICEPDVSLKLRYRQLQWTDFSRWQGTADEACFQELTEALIHQYGLTPKQVSDQGDVDETGVGLEETQRPSVDDSASHMSSSRKSAQPARLVPAVTQLNFDDLFDRNFQGHEPALVEIKSGTFTPDVSNPEFFTPAMAKRFSQSPDVEVSTFRMMMHCVSKADWQAAIDAEAPLRAIPCEGQAHEPIVNVTWNDAMDYAAWLNTQLRPEFRGMEFRLPTEAEWEYACRAGSSTAFNTGDSITPNQANFDARQSSRHSDQSFAAHTLFRGKPVPARQFSPNAFGLFEMHGNVWEWTLDAKSDAPFQPLDIVLGHSAARADRVIRGGAFDCPMEWISSSARGTVAQKSASPNRGFRLAFSSQ